jgi:hypothetical protein
MVDSILIVLYLIVWLAFVLAIKTVVVRLIRKLLK